MRNGEASVFNGCPFLFSLLPPLEKEQKADSDDDPGIGDIERGPMIVPDIEVEKIDDTTMKDSVEKVSRRPPENEGQRIELARFRHFLFMAVIENREQGQRGKENEPSLMGFVLGLRKEAKHDPGVPHGDDPEKMGNDVSVSPDRNF